MSNFKGTKGKFSDGHTGWKIDNRITNGVRGFEIHYSDDGECITDHVYTLEDAKLIACAPEMVEMLQELVRCNDLGIQIGQFDKALELIKKATE